MALPLTREHACFSVDTPPHTLPLAVNAREGGVVDEPAGRLCAARGLKRGNQSCPLGALGLPSGGPGRDAVHGVVLWGNPIQTPTTCGACNALGPLARAESTRPATPTFTL